MYVRRILAGSATAVALLALTAGGANAQSKIQQLQDQIQDLQSNYQNQIQGLQAQINQLKDQQRQQAEQAEVVRQQAAQVEAEYKKASSGLGGTYHIGGVTLKVGGFIESATIYRSANETADVGSVLGSNKNSGIPFNNAFLTTSAITAGSSVGVNNSKIDEFRESARQSRLSLLATGSPDPVTNLTAYFETDFLGQAGTANSNESNSYNLRLRQAFAEYDRTDMGLSLVFGQTWSLATLETAGLYPRNEAVPLTIDAQYNVGFNWMRQPGLRLVENFAPGWYGAISAENPQLNNPYNEPAYSVAKETGSSGGLLNGGGGTTTFSFDGMPDIIAKVAAEPGWGHFELYGLARQFRADNLASTPAGFGGTAIVLPGTATAGLKSAFGGGVGFGAVLPVIPKMLDVTVSGLYGEGIGKYASGQLPDVTFNPLTGSITPIPEIEAMVGVIGHPAPTVDLYGYAGIEHETAKSFGTTAATAGGYGNPLYNNTNCAYGNNSVAAGPGVLTSKNGTCDVDTLYEFQVGGWWNFYKGQYGRMALGASYAYVGVDTFAGFGGAPTTGDNIVMVSFRYYPF